MKKHSLVPNKGLSLSQAQSISNLCNQRARDIETILEGVNNAGKVVKVNRKEFYPILEAKKMPENVVALLGKKAKLHACQAFLMENIKAKSILLAEVRNDVFNNTELLKTVPVEPKYIDISKQILPIVDEEWGWAQLSISEYNEFLEAEAFASHVGQFIHKNSPLDRLRKELPTIQPTEWMRVKDDKKSPVVVTVHHTADELLSIHEELAVLHRQHEQRVNYFKAKIKNLVTKENARIAKVNADLQNDAEAKNNELRINYGTELRAHNENIKTNIAEFEKERQVRIMKTAAMRIKIDSRFQEVVYGFLSQLVEDA